MLNLDGTIFVYATLQRNNLCSFISSNYWTFCPFQYILRRTAYMATNLIALNAMLVHFILFILSCIRVNSNLSAEKQFDPWFAKCHGLFLFFIAGSKKLVSCATIALFVMWVVYILKHQNINLVWQNENLCFLAFWKQF